MKIKIAFLSSYMPKKGPVKVLLETIKNINFDLFEIYVFTFRDEEKDSYREEFLKYPIHYKQIKAGSLKNVFKCAKVLQQELDVNNIKIVHSHCLPTLFVSVFLKNVKRLNTIHIYPGIQLIKKKGKVAGTLFNFLNKLALKKIEKPISCSKSISQEFKLKDSVSYGYVQNGVSLVDYPERDRVSLCRELYLDPTFKYLVSFGRFSKEKNFEYLFECFSKLQLPKYKLIVLGTGPLFESLKSKETESIIIPGFRSNIYDYLYISDFYVSSSITEGLPMSVLEALSMRKPVLLSNIDSHIEILEGSSIGGKYELDNPSSFVSEFNNLISKDYDVLSQNSYNHFVNNFSSKIMTENYEEIYLNLV